MSRFSIVKFSEWIVPLITSGAKVIPGRLPDMPNRVIGIRSSPGPGLAMDGIFDVVGITIECRGGENNYADAEFIAGEVDDIFLGKHSTALSENFIIGEDANSTVINGMGRVGGGPVSLTMPDSTSRWTFMCSYFAYVSTDVGQVFNG